MPTDRVFLTGASGFVGSHVLRELLAAGYAVRALVRSGTPPESLGVERVEGDLLAPGAFARSLQGCRYLVHCAALYSFAPADRKKLRDVNVAGTTGLLEAARIAGIDRAIVTSSSATLGAAHDGRPRTEDDYAQNDGVSAYHQSKIDQERAAFAARVPVVALLPTAPVGPGDAKPTPTGRLVLEFARGRIFAKPPRGGLNLVPVEDVARAHVSALQNGRLGERYILGGEDLTLDRVWAMLARVTGVAVPRWRVPKSLALAIAHADELRAGIMRQPPFVPVEGVRMSSELMFANSGKAMRELGFKPGPVDAALERSVAWYRAHGYCN